MTLDLDVRARVRHREHPFPLEQDVPIPKGRQAGIHRSWDRRNFGFGRMRVGDSFRVYPQEGQPLIVCQNEVSGAACLYARAHHGYVQFTTRQIDGTHVRCWRTS